MNKDQRTRYICEAQKAFARECPGADPKMHFKAWRDAEKAYVFFGVERDFAGFNQLDLTRCLLHWRALQSGERLSPEDLLKRAVQRQGDNRLEPLRPTWDAIEFKVRQKVIFDLHKFTLFEELAGLDDQLFGAMRKTLERLARDYPKGQNPAVSRQESAAGETTELSQLDHLNTEGDTEHAD